MFPLQNAVTHPEKRLWNTIQGSSAQQGPGLPMPANFKAL